MTVGTMQKLAFQNEELSLTINFKQLHHSACENLLGINIDSNLNWKNASFLDILKQEDIYDI
jgi:hypothetical protein